MNRKTKGIAIGISIFILVVLMLGSPVLARNFSKTIDIVYKDIKILVDGSLIIPKDAKGRIVEPFIYEGTTYLPVRAISEALGKQVEWDGATNSIYIGEQIPQDIVEVTVSTAEELLSALGSNRRILLEEGEYNLTNVNPSYINNPSISYREAYDGPELLLNGVANLTIQGAGDQESVIIVDPRYAYVMCFQESSNINIVNLTAGHTEGGYCTGGVFSFENSSGIKIEDALMYGCGTIGLDLSYVSGMAVVNSSIYECTYGIMSVQNCSDISFMDCTFRDNKGFIMVQVGETSGFVIDSCSFLRNINDALYFPDPFFSISQSENVVIKNTLFSKNKAEKLIEQDGFVFDVSNTFENNSFDG